MMSKKYFILLIFILSLVSYQKLYAHNENSNIENIKASRNAEEQQKTRESWDVFMQAIKDQEKEKDTDKNRVNQSSSGQ